MVVVATHDTMDNEQHGHRNQNKAERIHKHLFPETGCAVIIFSSNIPYNDAY